MSLAAVRAGARQVQGTLNGLGERCGNANLCTLLPNLMLKEPFASQFETGVTAQNLAQLTHVSRLLDEILNRAPDRYAPYVGPSAFVHKGGLHSSAVLKDPTTYEHVKPESVGNERIIPVSDQAGPQQCAGAAGRGRHRRWTPRTRGWRGCWKTSRRAQRPAMPMTAPKPASNCWRGARWARCRIISRWKSSASRWSAAATATTSSAKAKAWCA